jgi:hypothetical protein
LGQLQQIGYSKQGPTGSHNDERVYLSNIGPIRWNGLQSTILVVEPHPVFAPVLAVADHFELLLKQWMVRMNDSERSVLNASMRCICKPM